MGNIPLQQRCASKAFLWEEGPKVELLVQFIHTTHCYIAPSQDKLLGPPGLVCGLTALTSLRLRRCVEGGEGEVRLA